MINTLNLPKAYSEAYSFLNTLGSEYINKIPDNIYNTIKDNRDSDYNPIYEKDQNIENEIMSYEAIALISALNLQYWCDPDEKEKLKHKYIENTKEKDKKYNSVNIFNQKEKEIKSVSENISNRNTEIIEYKDSIFIKIKKCFKKIFKK